MITSVLWGQWLTVLLPALCLGAYWAFGQTGLVIMALGLPAVWVVLGGFDAPDDHIDTATASKTLEHSDQLAVHISDLLLTAAPSERMALFCIGIDDSDAIIKRLGSKNLEDIQLNLQMRYASRLRNTDFVFLSGKLHWTIAVTPGRNLDLEAAIQQASRLQEVADDAFYIGSERVYLSSSIGFTLAQMPYETPHVLIAQAQSALIEATANGPDAIRAYTSNTRQSSAPRSINSQGKLDGTLENCVAAWFQPQLSTDTGNISGFEALARWRNADGTWLAPAAFMPVLEKSGQMEHLTTIMLAQGLNALAQWDKAGFKVDSIGINFSESDLTNPRLCEKVAWELDRYNIAPERLSIEVLESVIAGDADDVIVRNVTQLSNLGCQIDLDDFGTGQ